VLGLHVGRDRDDREAWRTAICSALWTCSRPATGRRPTTSCRKTTPRWPPGCMASSNARGRPRQRALLVWQGRSRLRGREGGAGGDRGRPPAKQSTLTLLAERRRASQPVQDSWHGKLRMVSPRDGRKMSRMLRRKRRGGSHEIPTRSAQSKRNRSIRCLGSRRFYPCRPRRRGLVPTVANGHKAPRS